jgi:ribosomal protein L24
MKPNDQVLVIGGPRDEIGKTGRVVAIVERSHWRIDVSIEGTICHFDRHELMMTGGLSRADTDALTGETA